ncbi:Glutamate carboxypeptidase, partial [Globisporangium splendens]
MMPLSSPTRDAHSRSKYTSVPSSSHSPRDAYGTFGFSENEDDDLLLSKDHGARRFRPHSRGISAHLRTIRTIGVVGIFVLAVSYMLIAREPSKASASPSPSSSSLAPSIPHHHDAEQEQDGKPVTHDALQFDEVNSVLNDVEKRFMDGIDANKLREYLHAYASVPHVAGSEQDYQTALYTAKQFESFGINATIKEYYTLLSLPVRRHLAIVEPQSAVRELNLTEASVDGDECTSNEDALPPFLAYTASGNVTASVVYANFGTPADFKWLVENNVTLKGKIALIRYGGNYRGLKVMVAEEHGMAGVLIYSDPHEDGFALGETYPNGPWRPEGSFQRGSSIFLSLATGDPLTPGFASNLGAPYLSIEESKTIPHIPALPLSYEQATYILKSLGGKKVPSAWRGSLTINDGYQVGDDEATVVNLDVEMDNKIGPIWDVIGTIDGTEEPDQHVLIGNHRDAWVCGAVDPSSGSAVMLEIARNLGVLLKNGWKPRRKLILGSWDGEEPGLLGSTEWVEDHAASLKKHAVAYINVDSVLGPFVASSGTPSIAEFMLQTAKAVPANKFFGNETESSLYEQWSKQTAQKKALLGAASERGTLGPDHMIGFLGSGTDFTPFYQHLGIISASLGFSIGPSMYGVYHSTMDSLKYLESFGDPNYGTQATTSKWWGLLALRLVDNLIVPFDFSTYGSIMAESLVGFEDQVVALKRDVSFTKLYDVINEFTTNAALFQARIADFAEKTRDDNDEETVKRRRKWNEKLVSLERYLLSDDGLGHRPWFKHVIFGPGFYEGYSGTAFPGIADCIAFEDDSKTIQAHVDEVADIVKNAAAFLISS